jgi:hypothetical protein
MNATRPLLLLGLLSAGGLLAGCQGSGAPPPQPAATQSSDLITPDGDRLDGPIPYPHWPYDINQGGGGGHTH